MSNAPSLVTSDQSALSAERPQELIILVHGIRTFANWQAMVRRVLQEIPNTTVVPIRFGYLDAIRFWFPFFGRAYPVAVVQREIQNVQSRHPHARISVIAHSFGTYAITEILSNTPNVILQRLVLCGSIVNREFRWETIRPQIMTSVVNDYGTRDIWPVLAKCLSWGYGDTGRHTFGRSAVNDRGHDFGHSGFFDEKFVRKYWKPWFEKGEWVDSPWTEKAPPSSWLLSLLSILPLRWVPLLLVLVVGAAWYFRSPPEYRESMEGHVNALSAVGSDLNRRREFEEQYLGRRVNWRAYVVDEVERGYEVRSGSTGEAQAIVEFKEGAFKPDIKAGTLISFKGTLHVSLLSGKISIIDAHDLQVVLDEP